MPASSVDDYIAGFPPDVQELLQAVRTTIRTAAPDAEERMGYGIPAYHLAGRPLIYFAGFKKHIGVYPAPRAHPELAEELAGYAGGKGTVQFPLGRPIPHDLIRRITAIRVADNLERGGGRGKAPGG